MSGSEDYWEPVFGRVMSWLGRDDFKLMMLAPDERLPNNAICIVLRDTFLDNAGGIESYRFRRNLWEELP